MAKLKKPTVQKKTMPTELKNEAGHMIANGLSEAILGFDPSSPLSTQLSRVETLFRNERWYLISNMRQILSQMYVEHGIVQTIVDVPVDDGLRGGVEIKTKQLDSAQIDKILARMDRMDVLNTAVGQSMKWNRLYGGAGIIILTGQDPSTPFNIGSINKNDPIDFISVDMWELFYDLQNFEGYNPVTQTTDLEYFSYNGVRVHKSRVMVMKGLTAPSFIRPRLRGWGFSIVEALVRSLNQFLKNQDLTFEVLDEFKLDIFGFEGLNSLFLSPNGTRKVNERVQLANRQKNFQNSIVMDANDKYEQKQLSFAGIADIMKEIRMQIACDMRMPLTKIFGISAQGFNAGEEDIENYNQMIEAQIRAKCKYDILRIIEIISQSEFGFVPDDLRIEFKPLRTLSAEQEQNVKNSVFNRLSQARTLGEISSSQFREGCNKDNLLPLQLDEDDIEDDFEDTASEEDGANKPDETSDGVAPKAKQDPKDAPEPKTKQ